jgi:hypothetical protein
VAVLAAGAFIAAALPFSTRASAEEHAALEARESRGYQTGELARAAA